jgi:hypothetical protein
MMKKFMALIPIILLALLLMAADDPVAMIRLTIVNKSDTDIAVQLVGRDHPCCNKADVDRGELYYLPVEEGSKEKPTIKAFDIEKNTYTMNLYYISTYDPVYGFKCDPTAPNPLVAGRNLRVVVLPCSAPPVNRPWTVGEPSMWKYLPFPVEALAIPFNNYWKTRLIY